MTCGSQALLCLIGGASLLALTPALAGETTTYSYDALGRLTGTAVSGTTNDGVQSIISFDPAGNRTGYVVTGAVDPATFSVANAAVTEGSNLAFNVTRSGLTVTAVDVNYATSNGSALAGSDYTSTSGTLSFAAGETVKTITVPIVNDSTAELGESFTVTLSSPTNDALLGDASATGTITDNDATPISFAVSNASTASEGGSLVFTVTKSGKTAVSTSVNYATANGSAAAGSDYTARSGTLTFAPNESAKTVSVTTIEDSAIEAGETVVVNLSGATSGATISDSQGSGTIANDDVSLAIGNPAAVSEGGTLVFTVTKTGTISSSLSVSYATANGSAVAGSDYTTTSGTLTFASGDTSKTISVPTSNDSTAELGESFTVTLSSPTNGAVLGDASATGTITDNDATPISFAVSNAPTVSEGGSLVFTVTKSGKTALSTNVNYATANGSAAAGSDYTARSGTLTFAPSETTKTVSVATVEESVIEAGESVRLNLSGATGGATISDTQGSGTIANDDASFAIGNAATVMEGSTLSFTVTKTGTVSSSLSVSYATANGSAVAGSDYTAKSGTLTFASGDTSKIVSVATTNDTTGENAETMSVSLSSPTGGATISDATGSATINSDEAPNIPPVAVDDGGFVPLCEYKTFNVVANDTDADGDYPLTLVSSSGAGTKVSSTSIRFYGLSGRSQTATYVVQDTRGAQDTGTITVSTPSGLCP